MTICDFYDSFLAWNSPVVRASIMPVVSLRSPHDILPLVFVVAAFLAIRIYRRRGRLPYPPGPRPLPLVGNLFDIPKEFSWLSYAQLSKKHGDVLSFHVFGKVIVVLNSLKANKDLLEKRGDIYSDRPVIPIVEMMKWGWIVTFSGYTESWRQIRKMLDRSLRPAAVAGYRPLMQTKAHVFLNRLLSNPDELEAHLHHMSGSLILAMGFGYEVKGLNDRKVSAAKKLVDLAGELTFPGALLVNDLPFLRHIPEWLPWWSYKPLARHGYNIGQQVLHEPMQFVRESIRNGTAQPSLALENLRETEKLEGPEREKAEEIVGRALGSMDLGGNDTTSNSVMTFIVAALLYPEIQKKALEELDVVTMRERLPTFEDRPRLPYIDAICKEITRWRPITPLGMPHASSEDDVYEGYFIPKGAIVAMNVWAVLHDPVMYPDPDSFKPERFINPDGSVMEDPVLWIAFGSGKRICPGRHLADSTLFIVVASLLAVFNFRGKGTDKRPDAYPFTGSCLSVPCPFTCSITPRDKRAEELITAVAQA